MRTATNLTAELFEQRRKATVLIGIDPGTHTGYAKSVFGKLVSVETVNIYTAIRLLEGEKRFCEKEGVVLFVRVEDARLRTWFGNTGREKLKGAGSVERDCAIWQEVLSDLKIPFEFVHPKQVKATTADVFEKMTGWKGRTSIHAREAAWLIL